MGGMLRETERARGTRGQLKGRNISGSIKLEQPEDSTPTLSDLGIDRKRGEWIRENIPEEGAKGIGVRPKMATLSAAGISHHESPILRGLAELPEKVGTEWGQKAVLARKKP